MKKNTVVEQIAEYIENNLEEELSLEKISNELNYSKFYMARIFADNKNCTIYKYIQEKRLAEAARKLIETNKPIIEIAYEAQYNSQQAFSLAFQRKYFCTPAKYRKYNSEVRMAA
ncbi:MAG: helix-turn-helix transcriptional regulator [Lachnospiraceae bacterium]|nr:helix-turn-helix transcriptional regulator [Lachnospiraceae bacterium]